MSNVLGLRLSESRVKCLLDFFEALRCGASKNVSNETELDLLNVFRRLRESVRKCGEGYSCLGVNVPTLVRLDLDDAFRDISIYCYFNKDYKKEVLDVFWSVLDVLISTL